MDIAVLGGGNGSTAAAADLSEQKHRVRLWRRNAEAVAALRAADNTLTLLTEMATISSDLSAEEADAELAEAAARVAQSGQDLERVQRDQQRAYAKRQTIREASAS